MHDETRTAQDGRGRQQPTEEPLDGKKMAREYTRKVWATAWNRYAYEVRREKPPAQETLWTGKVPLLHKGLTKAESAIATQLRTGRIGLKSYLHDRGVPGFDSPSCPCGSNRQTAKHIVIHCPLYIEGRAAMLHRAGTSDYRSILRTNKGLRAVTRWLVRSGALQQFSLAREMAIEDMGNGEDDA